MSSLDVERRLTEVLHRRAEVVMSRTDTQEELREFLTRGDPEPPRAFGRNRFTAVVAAGVAAAAAAAAVFWAADLTADRATEPLPVQQPAADPVEVAEKFVAAYATNDVETVAALAPPDGDQVQDWRIFMARDAAWGVEFLFEPCRRATDADIGTGVVCPFALHVLGSEEVGSGPFENATFTVWVNGAGQVFDADPTWNHEYNGMWKHVEEATDWVWAQHPDQAEFLMLDEPDVPPAQLDRWLGLWERYLAEYVDAHAKD
jgi:hypothetical protein